MDSETERVSWEKEMEEGEDEGRIAVRPSRHKKPKEVRGAVFYIRQILNILFMVTAIIGAMMYSGFMGEGIKERQGIIIIIIAVSIKMAECMLRFKK